MEDTYLSIKEEADTCLVEKRSRFLGFAHPVRSREEVQQILRTYEQKYYDARHVCYAYMLGHERQDFRASDNGEPSGTAGRPILGQINSLGLTDVLVVVVRYFGGVKLGTPGLTAAYRQTAREVLEKAGTMEHILRLEMSVRLEYPFLSEALRQIREAGAEVLSQGWDGDCTLSFLVRSRDAQMLREKLSKVRTLRLADLKDRP